MTETAAGRAAEAWADTEQPEGMSAMDLVEAAGITYRQLDYWTRVGLIKDLPRKVRDPHQGHPRRYSVGEADACILSGELVRVGFKPTDAVELAREMIRVSADGTVPFARRGRITLILDEPAPSPAT